MQVNKFSVAGLSSMRRIDLPAGQQQCGAMREHEAQRLPGREARKRGVYARAATLLGTCVDLEVRQRVMREVDELLPDAVGGASRSGRSRVVLCLAQRPGQPRDQRPHGADESAAPHNLLRRWMARCDVAGRLR